MTFLFSKTLQREHLAETSQQRKNNEPEGNKYVAFRRGGGNYTKVTGSQNYPEV